ncbi:hypothetical protein Scep_020219 [Stephania cephalantha]|uniref:Glycoside hydrolase family 31 TIM barrel domain-containing protein n=1 Tax=Stephania cephalantha TaxID=152367 RepID=A0AAP0ICE1_9MAGN
MFGRGASDPFCFVPNGKGKCQDRFPNPKALVNELHLNGFKAIWMLDPGIKHEEGYFVYDSGSKGDVWIQNVDEKPFVVDIPFNT